MTFEEAFTLATSLGKDIVLRNTHTDPPVLKIMDYKVELVKRVFKKLAQTLTINCFHNLSDASRLFL